MSISNLTWKLLKSVKQSVVPDHLHECNCSIDFDYLDILASDANSDFLLTKVDWLNITIPVKQNYQVISVKATHNWDYLSITGNMDQTVDSKSNGR